MFKVIICRDLTLNLHILMSFLVKLLTFFSFRSKAALNLSGHVCFC